jgi:hypothetical protein
MMTIANVPFFENTKSYHLNKKGGLSHIQSVDRGIASLGADSEGNLAIFINEQNVMKEAAARNAKLENPTTNPGSQTNPPKALGASTADTANSSAKEEEEDMLPKVPFPLGGRFPG